MSVGLCQRVPGEGRALAAVSGDARVMCLGWCRAGQRAGSQAVRDHESFTIADDREWTKEVQLGGGCIRKARNTNSSTSRTRSRRQVVTRGR